MTYYTVNMDYSSNCSSEHNVFSSRRFTSRDEAREAMEFMQDLGFHKAVNSDVFANYTIVTYTRFGDVVNSASYDEEVYSEPVKCRRSLRLDGKKIKITVKPKSSRHSSSLRRSSRLRHNSLSKSSLSSSPPSPPSSETVSDTVNEINVSNGRHYEAYGKGYLLHPSGEDDPDYGEKYFHEGFWNVKQNAWFFRKQHLNTVKELCTHKTLHHNTKTAEVTDSSWDKSHTILRRGKRYRWRARSKKTGRTLVRYGKGWLLKPLNEDDSDWGEKYYKGGWWMPSQNAWFFKKGIKIPS